VKILMISPHPTYSPRGTPISVLNRCRALSALGHEVDLVTYGIGEDVPVPGLRYLRAPVPGIHQVKVGPSAAKLPLNTAVFARALMTLLRHPRRYHALHTHEEAGIFGAVVARAFRLPHIYDMGNDLDAVLGNYGFQPRHPLRKTARLVENMTIRSADVVIAHFPSLVVRAREVNPQAWCEVVYNVPLSSRVEPHLVAKYRDEWTASSKPVVVYTGTLETYQGISNLLDAVALDSSGYRLVLVGGSVPQQDTIRAQIRTAQLGDSVLVAGQLPSAHIPSCLAAADALVSPRSAGTNTPLKIFEYMHSGRPIVATRVPSHTTVLDEDIAILTSAEPSELAAALTKATHGGPAVDAIAHAARSRAKEHYGATGYVRAIANAYSHIGGFPEAGAVAIGDAIHRLGQQKI
jgi:glycosyltransferase involved in cell wall biosynthesis